MCRFHKQFTARTSQSTIKWMTKVVQTSQEVLWCSTLVYGFVIDGMDQKKTLFPHFVCVPKNLKEENFIQFHLVGCMVFNGEMIPSLLYSSKYSQWCKFDHQHNSPCHYSLAWWSSRSPISTIGQHKPGKQKPGRVWLSKHACRIGNF